MSHIAETLDLHATKEVYIQNATKEL